jgi:hypothetical protein
MSERPNESEFVFHLLLAHEEAQLVKHALDLLISDEAHEGDIRAIARGVIKELHAQLAVAPVAARHSGESVGGELHPDATLTVALTPPQMKITHTAVKLLLDDTQREQHSERQLLWSVLEKLPDEHAIRAIELH